MGIKGRSNESRDKLLSRMAHKLQGSKIAQQQWVDQFKDAIFKVLDDDDDEDGDDDGGGEPSMSDFFFHFVKLPWKLLFAFVPPTGYCGGWMTFSISLAFIGLI